MSMVDLLLALLTGLCFGANDRVVQIPADASDPTINHRYRNKIQEGSFANAIGRID
jgi:hypothetical protein